MPAAECKFIPKSLLDDSMRDSWPAGGHDRRALRCTGVALSIAIGLAETTCPQSSARMSLIVGGPCNTGPGMVVGKELAETICSHLDLQKDTAKAKYTKPALKFYTSLASQADGSRLCCGHLCLLPGPGQFERSEGGRR